MRTRRFFSGSFDVVRSVLLATVVGSCGAWSPVVGRADDLVLARDGRSDYQIVLPKPIDGAGGASVAAGLAQTARLVATAFQMNGFETPVVVESDRDPARPGVYLGDTQFARQHGVDVQRLEGWGYVQKAFGRDVVIAGRDQPSPAKSGNSRRPTWDRLGTAKGAADFLRQFVGVRFLYPDLAPYSPIRLAEKIDLAKSPAIEFLKTPTIAVPSDLDVRRTPSLEYNTAHPAGGSFYDIAHNRYPLVDATFGGHTYDRAIPPEKYRATHPEYFALVGGKRLTDGVAQYCISNPEVQELFYQDLIANIDRGYQNVDLGQPDGFRPCKCEQCEKLFGVGSDWGEKLWILHRQLAERVQQARPGKLVTMMSYIQTAKPPKSFREFPANTRIMLTGTNEEDLAPWRDHVAPQGFTSYIYNWCPNLGSRYTPMRTPRFVESQARRLHAAKIRSIYRDGPGSLFGLEGPVHYTMGRMFDDPENNQAKQLVHEFCGAAFGRSAPSMISFYDQLYHGIELYSDQLGTRAPAWTYHTIYGQRRKSLSDPFQLLGFLYPPRLLESLETALGQAEKAADGDKVRARLALVRREFDYVKHLARVVHLVHAYQIQPDLASRNRVLDAIDQRNALIAGMFGDRKRPLPVSEGWSHVMFPPLGHDENHLRLAHDGYQEPFANTPLNWDTRAMRNAPLPGASRLAIRPAAQPVTLDSPEWKSAAVGALAALPNSGAAPGGLSRTTKFQTLVDARHLYVRIECDLPTAARNSESAEGAVAGVAAADWRKRDAVDVYLAPPTEKDVWYRLTVGPRAEQKEDAAQGFIADPLDPRHGRYDPDWNGTWTYETAYDGVTQRWLGLLRIPHATLGADSPKAGGFWRGNVTRTVSAGAERAEQVERSLWSATSATRSLDDRNDFGEFVFELPDDEK